MQARGCQNILLKNDMESVSMEYANQTITNFMKKNTFHFFLLRNDREGKETFHA
jgi:hypothetical protein